MKTSACWRDDSVVQAKERITEKKGRIKNFLKTENIADLINWILSD